MKKVLSIVAVLFLAFLAVGGYVFYERNLSGAYPVIFRPSQDIAELLPDPDAESGENDAGVPLKLPTGFSISVLAKNLPNARVLAFDRENNLWVSRTGSGAITKINIQEGGVRDQADVFQDLKNPHGLVFDPDDPRVLYFAEENKISKVRLDVGVRPEKIADLPAGGGHSTRTLLFGQALSAGPAGPRTTGRLYVSIGSSCNVCAERDSRRAKIFSLQKDGSDFREFASGLRNAVFMTLHPETLEIWATEMGRDLLGDDVPPEEINIVREGKNYGWPYCYSDNVHDDNFDPDRKVSCADKIPPHISFQAHSAPLGLAFIPKDSSWPAEYRGDLLVAYHGSWNRSVPTGYKIVRFDLDENGQAIGGEKDFISGWLQGATALGRPVDLKFGPDGALYVSDDKAGVIYKVVYVGS